MLLSVIRYLKGYVRIRFQGYSPERFLNLCSHHQIFIWGLNPSGNAYEMCVSLPDFRKLKPLLKKTKTRLSVLEKKGLPFFFYRNRKRKMYFAGGLICACLLYFYTCFIWDIHFEGNETRTQEVLLEFLESCKVKPGMRKNEVDCEQIAREIRKEFDDIVWVSASVDGSRLTIQVKENDALLQTEEENMQENPCDLIAEKDAVIVEIVTRQGVPYVHEGDIVHKGDLLVSGRVEVLNDSKEVVGYQYHKADADIWGATVMKYEEILNTAYEKKDYASGKNQNIFLLQIGQYQIWTGKRRKIPEGLQEEVLTWKRQLKLGENLYLPVYYGKIQQKGYCLKKAVYEKEEIRKILSSQFSRFCEELVKKGVQITENNVKILIDKNQAVAKGTLSLIEPLGEPAETEILSIERNETDESFGNNN